MQTSKQEKSKKKSNKQKKAAETDKDKVICEQCEEFLQGWKRAMADYQNLKKDFEKKEKELIKFANSQLLLELIPVYSHFKKAFDCQPSEDADIKEWRNWMIGIGHIKKILSDFLERFGVEEIETIGQEFNPELHEAVGSEKSKEFKSGIVLKEVEPGYKLNGKVIIPAKVIVSE